MTDVATASKRTAFWIHVSVTALLTGASILLSFMSLSRIRLVHPDYPNLVQLGIYMPVRTVWFFHSLGVVGLLVVFVVFVSATAMFLRARWKFSLSCLLLVFFGHFLFLLFSILAHGHSLFRISNFFYQF